MPLTNVDTRTQPAAGETTAVIVTPGTPSPCSVTAPGAGPVGCGDDDGLRRGGPADGDAAAGEHGHGGRGRGDPGDEPSPPVGGGLGPDLAQGAVQHQVTVRRPLQQGLRRHLAEQIGHGGQVLQVAPAGRAPRQVLLDGARALRVEEPERQCAELAGVVLLRSVVRGAGVAGGVRTALGGHAGRKVGPFMPSHLPRSPRSR